MRFYLHQYAHPRSNHDLHLPSYPTYPLFLGSVSRGPYRLSCSGRFYDVQTGTLQARQWVNPRFSPSGTPYSFDHVGAALLTLFEVSPHLHTTSSRGLCIHAPP
jgi:hypothetical protein